MRENRVQSADLLSASDRASVGASRQGIGRSLYCTVPATERTADKCDDASRVTLDGGSPAANLSLIMNNSS